MFRGLHSGITSKWFLTAQGLASPMGATARAPYLPGSCKSLGTPVGVVPPNPDRPVSCCHHEQPSLHRSPALSKS